MNIMSGQVFQSPCEETLNSQICFFVCLQQDLSSSQLLFVGQPKLGLKLWILLLMLHESH